MKIFVLINLILLINFSILHADQKKIKKRGIADNTETKNIEINISPDLINLEVLKNLKENFKTASNYASVLDENLDDKKKIKYRGLASKIYKDNSNSVFFLYNPEIKALGTGFLVDETGLVLSNWHVVEKATSMYLWTLPVDGPSSDKLLFEKHEYYNSTVVAKNKKQDLAIVKVSGLPKTIKPVQLGTNDIINIGDDVFAIGHSMSLPWTFSKGMVSQIRKNYEWDGIENYKHQADVVQMQTPISTGNSGGPLFSSDGKVIGVNAFGFEEGQNLNFAVAVDHVRKFIEENPNVKKVNPLISSMKKEYPNAKLQDYNKNGVTDTWYVDLNNNGKTDIVFIDDNEDGFIEAAVIDENENGVYEATKVDENQDGKIDYILLDKDEDGKNELVATDFDQDGNFDKIEPLS